MYVHIGKDTIIPSKNIIAIINLEKLLNNKSMEEIKKEINLEKIIDISLGNKKALLIAKNKEKTEGYISNISSTTLAKRFQKEIL
jgi:hypothetical protein